MAIINDFDDLRFVIRDLSEETIRRMVADREFAVIKVAPEAYNDQKKHSYAKWDLNEIVLSAVHEHYTLEIDCGGMSKVKTCLWIKSSSSIKHREIEGVEITYPSIDELIRMLRGKRFIFSIHHYVEGCSAEETVNKELREFVFNLYKEGEYYLKNSSFDIRIFLQKVSDGSAHKARFIEPIDVRNLDINGKLLSVLEKKSNAFYDDAWTIKYESESPELKAQYFLSKFHSNRNWAADPLCIMNCRATAYVLPCVMSKYESDDIPKDRIAFDYVSGTKYVIDSIHVNSDICFSLSEFEKPFGWFIHSIAHD